MAMPAHIKTFASSIMSAIARAPGCRALFSPSLAAMPAIAMVIAASAAYAEAPLLPASTQCPFRRRRRAQRPPPPP